MWNLRRTKAPSVRPLVPDGLRIYAVGDIHGRADLLERLFSRIDEDLKDHPIAETMHIFLGDYIDRGRDSAAVLDLLIERAKAHRMVCLKGNHEIYLSEFLENPGILGAWAQYGALPTLASYGLTPKINAGPRNRRTLPRAFSTPCPKAMLNFLPA